MDQLELLKLSLSQRHAKQKLLDGISEQLQLERRRLSWLPCLALLALTEPGSLQTILSGVLLLLCSVAGCDRTRSAWSAALAAALLLLALMNAYVTAHEKNREETELISRVRAWLNQVSQHHTLFRSATSHSPRAQKNISRPISPMSTTSSFGG